MTEEVHSRITDDDHFANLPDIDVMNNAKKPKSPESPSRPKQRVGSGTSQKSLAQQ